MSLEVFKCLYGYNGLHFLYTYSIGQYTLRHLYQEMELCVLTVVFYPLKLNARVKYLGKNIDVFR